MFTVQSAEEAQGSRAPTQRFVDKSSKVIVFALALAVAVFPPLVLGAQWMP